MRFAHFSDIHLGFQKEKSLQDIEQAVFERALDDCIRRSVDFILICGDMFHVNIPRMQVQKFAFASLRRVHEAGIPVYAIYGSHDFSPSATSVIDLLVETGYITRVQTFADPEDEKKGGAMSLGFVTDEKTGAKLAGISGLGASKDMIYYENLDRDALEAEPGFRIFMFHGAISEMRTAGDAAQVADAAMPLSYLPRNFDYYAGGHMHKYQYRGKQFENYPHVVYPGTLFAGFHSDLAENAGGVKRGYVLVEFDGTGVTAVQQVEVKNCKYDVIRINATHKTSHAVSEEINEKLADMEPDGKVVLLNVSGKMSEGKTTDIDFAAISDGLHKKGTVEVKISRRQLSSAEYEITESRGDTAEEIAVNTFVENIGQVDSEFAQIIGTGGAKLAKRLLDILSKPALENEPLHVYQKRIADEAVAELRLDEEEEEEEEDARDNSARDEQTERGPLA